ncbi:MAG: hypothetical protein IKU93_02845 [Alistipes sp.]|nr:hypothetical protein [Alistipes sp.]
MRKTDKNTLEVMALMGVVAIVSLFCETPDSHIEFEGARQAWIGALAGALVSLGSSVASAVIGSKAAKKQGQAYDEAWNNYEDWYQGQMNTSILDRADTQAMLKNYRDWQEENARKYQTNAIKGGASEEAKVAYAQAANKGYADAVSQIAAQGQRYKDQLSQKFGSDQFAYAKDRANIVAQGSQAVVNAISSAGGTIGDILGGMNWGKSTGGASSS